MPSRRARLALGASAIVPVVGFVAWILYDIYWTDHWMPPYPADSTPAMPWLGLFTILPMLVVAAAWEVVGVVRLDSTCLWFATWGFAGVAATIAGVVSVALAGAVARGESGWGEMMCGFVVAAYFAAVGYGHRWLALSAGRG